MKETWCPLHGSPSEHDIFPVSYSLTLSGNLHCIQEPEANSCLGGGPFPRHTFWILNLQLWEPAQSEQHAVDCVRSVPEPQSRSAGLCLPPLQAPAFTPINFYPGAISPGACPSFGDQDPWQPEGPLFLCIQSVSLRKCIRPPSRMRWLRISEPSHITPCVFDVWLPKLSSFRMLPQSCSLHERVFFFFSFLFFHA